MGVCKVERSARGLRSRRKLEEDRGGLLRPDRRLKESDRTGGGGGRLDLRREMLRVTVGE